MLFIIYLFIKRQCERRTFSPKRRNLMVLAKAKCMAFVYMMTNGNNSVLYTGVTNDLEKRVQEHKSGIGSKFTKRYKVVKLVYYEYGESIYDVIQREKQIKKYSRIKKGALIESINPEWLDLSDKV